MPGVSFAHRRLNPHSTGGFRTAFVPEFLSGFLGQPVAEVEKFLDFAPLIAIFERLFGLVIRFAEGMFCITDSFTDGLHGFHHSILPFIDRRLS